jgi:phosphate transport system substrate-binding protein
MDAEQAPPAPRDGAAGALRTRLAAAACLVVLTAAACSPAGVPSPAAQTRSATTVSLPSAPPAGPHTVSESGSTLLYPLFSAWAQAYRSQYSAVAISTASTGSSAGISAVSGGAADVGASDAYLPSGTVTLHPDLLNIPLVISAQLVSYNLPGVGAHLKLNSTVLAQMYQGTITSWDDPAIKALNPGVSLPATKIIPVHRSDGSGDTFLFTSYLSVQGSSWAGKIGFSTKVAWPQVPGAVAEQGNSGMVAGCLAHPGCIAYIGISYLSRAGGLGEAQLLNRSGRYVLPDAASISADAADFAVITPASGAISLINGPDPVAYPLVNYEYAIVSARQPDAAKAATIKALLNWILTKGSSPGFLGPVNFQPLPSQVAAIADALIARIG